MSENIENNITEKGFFEKLANGDFGLAKTYWIYGVLVSVVAQIIANLITSTGILFFIFLAMVVYTILIIMGVWRAADKYEGLKVWAILAKIVMVLWILSSCISIIIVFV